MSGTTYVLVAVNENCEIPGINKYVLTLRDGTKTLFPDLLKDVETKNSPVREGFHLYNGSKRSEAKWVDPVINKDVDIKDIFYSDGKNLLVFYAERCNKASCHVCKTTHTVTKPVVQKTRKKNVKAYSIRIRHYICPHLDCEGPCDSGDDLNPIYDVGDIAYIYADEVLLEKLRVNSYIENFAKAEIHYYWAVAHGEDTIMSELSENEKEMNMKKFVGQQKFDMTELGQATLIVFIKQCAPKEGGIKEYIKKINQISTTPSGSGDDDTKSIKDEISSDSRYRLFKEFYEHKFPNNQKGNEDNVSVPDDIEDKIYIAEPCLNEIPKELFNIRKKRKIVEKKQLLSSQTHIRKKYKVGPTDSTLEEILVKCSHEIIKKQLATIIGRGQIHINVPDGESNSNNTLLNANVFALGRELDVLETHLGGGRHAFAGQVDSVIQYLAASFVSGFVNAGFGRDKLLAENGIKWLHENKDHGMLSATASLGLILWDVDGGLGQIDKYLYSTEDYIKAGALLACGIVNCGVRNECDPSLPLLSDYVSHQNSIMKIGAILGLGLAYAGTNREDIIQLLNPVAVDTTNGLEIMGLSSLACGLVSVGTCNAEVTGLLLQCLMERTEQELKDTHARYIALAIGLCYLGRQESAQTVFTTLEVISEPFKSMAITLVEVCAYAGTGNVLKIQNLLRICSEHYDPIPEGGGGEKGRGGENDDKKESTKEKSSSSSSKENKKADDKDKVSPVSPNGTTGGKTTTTTTKDPCDLSLQQSVAVLGISLIAIGEDIGTEIAFRTFGYLLRYCEPSIRRAVPLALGLLTVSNPRLNVLDTLSKFSHDIDHEVALNSIFAMGIVGAKTDNAKVAAMLHQLSQYHSKDSNYLFMVRIAQGLVHLGKGTLGLTPFHSDRQLLSPVALGGLLTTLFTFLDVKGMILGRGHYMLYCLATAMNPRMLATFDSNLKPLPVTVRVGQAVDTVGVAGKPKTITGFQTYTTPVLLGPGERAELATDELLPLSPILKGFNS